MTVGDSNALLTALYVDGNSQHDRGINFGGASSDCRLGIHRSINNNGLNVRDAGTNNQKVSLTTI